MREAKLSLPMRALPRLGSGRCRIGEAHFTRLPAELGRIYELSCGLHPISLARTPAYWRNWPSWMIGNGAFTLSDRWVVAWRGDQPVAYGVAAHSSIAEICSLPGEEEALFNVFDGLVERMRRRRRERQLQLDLPLDHPLAGRLAVHAKEEAEVCGMILVLDLPGLLRELGPELAQRWHTAQPGCLRLESPLGAATLTVDRGEVRVDAAPGAPMLRLTPRGQLTAARVPVGRGPPASRADRGRGPGLGSGGPTLPLAVRSLLGGRQVLKARDYPQITQIAQSNALRLSTVAEAAREWRR